MEVAEAWAAGDTPPPSSEAVEQARAFGASEEYLAALRRMLVSDAAPPVLRVLPENWHAVHVFFGMSTQWRRLVCGDRVAFMGLDYSALPVVLREHAGNPHRRPLRELMPQLRELEDAAMQRLNKQ